MKPYQKKNSFNIEKKELKTLKLNLNQNGVVRLNLY